MTRDEYVSALLAGPKDRRAEVAITRELDAAIEISREDSIGLKRSDIFRVLLARAVAADPSLAERAIMRARESRVRDAQK